MPFFNSESLKLFWKNGFKKHLHHSVFAAIMFEIEKPDKTRFLTCICEERKQKERQISILICLVSKWCFILMFVVFKILTLGNNGFTRLFSL